MEARTDITAATLHLHVGAQFPSAGAFARALGESLAPPARQQRLSMRVSVAGVLLAAVALLAWSLATK